MSDVTPSWQPPETWEEWDALVRGWLQNSMGHLDPIINDQMEHWRVRQIALQAASTANAATILLSLLTGLANTVVQLQGVVREVIDRADLDEAVRAEVLGRVGQLEYATVAEGQLERIMEQITGDLADRMAGRLRGETDS